MTILDDDQGAGASQLSVGNAVVVGETDGGAGAPASRSRSRPSAAGPRCSVDVRDERRCAAGGARLHARRQARRRSPFAPGETSKTIEVADRSATTSTRPTRPSTSCSPAPTGAVAGATRSAWARSRTTTRRRSRLPRPSSTNEDTARAITLGGDATATGTRCRSSCSPRRSTGRSARSSATRSRTRPLPTTTAPTRSCSARTTASTSPLRRRSRSRSTRSPDAPVAGDDDVDATEDAPALIEVLRNDTRRRRRPADGRVDDATAARDGDGARRRPDPLRARRRTSPASDSFTYTVSDGVLTDTATVNVDGGARRRPAGRRATTPRSSAEDGQVADRAARQRRGGGRGRRRRARQRSRRASTGRVTQGDRADPHVRRRPELQRARRVQVHGRRTPAATRTSATVVVQVTPVNDAPTALGLGGVDARGHADDDRARRAPTWTATR